MFGNLQLIDSKAGTRFEGVQIALTNHAREQAIERYSNVKTTEDANRFLSTVLTDAALIDDDFDNDEKGTAQFLYAAGGIMFVVAHTTSAYTGAPVALIVTTYAYDGDMNTDLADDVLEVCNRHLKRAKAAEKIELDTIAAERAGIDAKRAALIDERNRLNEKIAEYDRELAAFTARADMARRARKKISKAVTAFMI
jgi:hypothetical protein